MRRLKDVILAAMLAASLVGPSPATATELNPDADLREALRAQGEIIQQLRDELDRVHEDQRRSEDRVRALEDERVNGSTSGVDAAFVDRRIEQYDTADESRLLLSGYGTAQFMDPEGGPSTFGVQFNPIFHFRLTDRLHFNSELEIDVTPRFLVGDPVRGRNMNPTTHTRMPRYTRGKKGVVQRDRGVFGLPDTESYGQDPRPQHVYLVRFEARELWGDQASANDSLYIDMWEDYLEPA